MTVMNLKEAAKQVLFGGRAKGASSGIDDLDLIQAVSEALKLQTEEERLGIKEALLPSMLCAAVAQGNIERIECKRAILFIKRNTSNMIWIIFSFEILWSRYVSCRL